MPRDPDCFVTRSKCVFDHAKSGDFAALKSLLSEYSVKDRKKLVERAQSNGEVCFVTAAKAGYVKVVQYLLEHCDVDIDMAASVVFDSERVEGVTALWCAAAGGHKDVVYYLVGKGADVNRRTVTNSTPLRAACFDGYCEIVRYLVNHSADFEIPNRHGHTCLMIACYRKQSNVVRYLVDQGARINRQSSKGNTALHDCAESGNEEDLYFLLHRFAIMQRDEFGLSPIMSAGNTGNVDIVKGLQRNYSEQISPLDIIQAYELLGANVLHTIGDKTRARIHWKKAIEYRLQWGYPKNIRLPFGWTAEEDILNYSKTNKWRYHSVVPSHQLGYCNKEIHNLRHCPTTTLPETQRKSALSVPQMQFALHAFSDVRNSEDLNRQMNKLLKLPGRDVDFQTKKNSFPIQLDPVECNDSPGRLVKLARHYDDGYYHVCTDYQEWLNERNTPPPRLAENRSVSCHSEGDIKNFLYNLRNLNPNVDVCQDYYRRMACGDDRLLSQSFLDECQVRRFQEVTRRTFVEVNHEFQNLEELNDAYADEDSIMQLHALMVRMRILGPQHADFLYQLRYRGALYADNGHVQNCLYMWMYVLELERLYLEPLGQINQASYASCLDLFHYVLQGRIASEASKEFQASWILHTICLGVNCLSRSRKWYHQNWQKQVNWAYTNADKEGRHMHSICITMICLIFMLLEYYELDVDIHESKQTDASRKPIPLTPSERQFALDRIRYLISLDVRVANGNTLLHLAFLSSTSRQDRSSGAHHQQIIDVGDGTGCMYPSHSVAFLLIKMLEHLNVHLDVCNQNGDTFTKTRWYLKFGKYGYNREFNVSKMRTLKCRAAAVVHADCFDRYDWNQFPEDLLRFIVIH